MGVGLGGGTTVAVGVVGCLDDWIRFELWGGGIQCRILECGIVPGTELLGDSLCWG